MKKITATLFLVICISSAAAAQVVYKGAWELGIEGGPSVCAMRGNETIEEVFKPGLRFACGGVIIFNASDKFAIHTGITFERKGGNAVSTMIQTDNNGNVLSTQDYTIRSRSDYLLVPVMLHTATGRRVTTFVNAGVYFGYLVKNSYRYDGISFTDPRSNYAADYNRLDAGLVGGVGLKFPVNRMHFTCELRNNLGIVSMYKAPANHEDKLRHYSLNLLFGCSYLLGNS